MNFDLSTTVFALVLTLCLTAQEPKPPTEVCCDFEFSLCNFINLNWMWTAYANQSDPTHVIPPHDGLYMWTSLINSQLLTTTLNVTRSSVYSFDYYVDMVDSNPNSDGYIDVNFRRSSDGHMAHMLSQLRSGSNWVNVRVEFSRCDGCCEGPTCLGQLMIIANGEYNTADFVAAIDNFGLESNCSQLYPPSPILPPPVYHECCDFESDVCDNMLFNFKWSAQQIPTQHVPESTGSYLWSSQPSSQIISGSFSNVINSTRFHFMFYATNTYTWPYVYFRDAATGSLQQTYTDVSGLGPWMMLEVTNDQYYPYCDNFPCSGELVIQFSDVYDVVGVDSIGRDDACEEVMPCCQFNDESMCNFNSSSEDGFVWKYSENYPPKNPPPNSGSQYVYFETENYNGSEVLDVVLESPTITVKNNSVFSGNIYMRNISSSIKDFGLIVAFYNDKTMASVVLGVVKNTSGEWQNVQFPCNKVRCCTDTQCTGKVQITAQVGSNGGSVMYAIDVFQVDGLCSTKSDKTPSELASLPQCCDFESDMCNFVSLDWQWSAQYNSTYSIPPYSGNYMFSNGDQGQLILPTIHVSRLTVVSFDYYGCNIYVKFRRASDGVVIDFPISYCTSDIYWENAFIYFDNCPECCDGESCDGQIIFVFNYPRGCIAIDNFDAGNNCTQHLPTLPPPVEHSFCDFESDVCDFKLLDFKWSAQYTTAYELPASSGEYLWSNVDGSQLISGRQYNVTSGTHLLFTYYLRNTEPKMYIYFANSINGQILLMDIGTLSIGKWQEVDLSCDAMCCSSYPCEGNLMIYFITYDEVVAIDSFGREDAFSLQ